MCHVLPRQRPTDPLANSSFSILGLFEDAYAMTVDEKFTATGPLGVQGMYYVPLWDFYLELPQARLIHALSVDLVDFEMFIELSDSEWFRSSLLQTVSD